MRRRVVWVGCTLAIAGVLTTGACGGGGSTPTSPTPSPDGTSPSNGTTITITSAGVSPQTVNVSPGTRVLFINDDRRSHDMSSDPHPEHTDCPEINQAGFLSPGQRRETGNLNTVRTCGFHDHDDPDDSRWIGRIVIR